MVRQIILNVYCIVAIYHCHARIRTFAQNATHSQTIIDQSKLIVYPGNCQYMYFIHEYDVPTVVGRVVFVLSI